jgi:hypothetical protein
MSNAWRLVCLGLLLCGGRAEARGCHDASEIVGMQRCTRFGRWDVSHSLAWVVSIGPSFDINPMIGSRFSVSAAGANGPVPLFAISGRDFQDRGVSIAPYTFRLTLFPRRVFYFGMEAVWPGSVGVLSGPVQPTSDRRAAADTSASSRSSGALAMHGTGFWMMTLGGVAGASLPVGRFDFSVELFGGLRALSANLEFDNSAAAATALGGCWLDAQQKPVCPGTPFTDWSVQARLEPRLGIAVRLSRIATARVLVGFDALALGAVHVGALIELHSRSYDAFFVRPPAAGAPD